MIRSAILIDAGNAISDNKLEGTLADVQSWEEYLLSNAGGAWLPNEITVLSNPTKAQVLAVIKKANLGYGFVGYAGHGESKVRKFSGIEISENFICLRDGDLSEKEITPDASRATVVMDSCRGISRFVESRHVMTFSERSNVPHYRQLFDAALGRSELGTCRLYACQLGGSAQESKRGGYFTESLIGAGRAFSQDGILNLRQAFELARVTVQVREPKQIPEAQFGRRMNHFPFAVHIR